MAILKMISVTESEINNCLKNVNECIFIAKHMNKTSQEILESTIEANKLSAEYFRAQTTQPYPGGLTIDNCNANQSASNMFLLNEQRKNNELREHIQKLCAFIGQIPRPLEIQDILRLYS